jgi:hypothetical protein
MNPPPIYLNRPPRRPGRSPRTNRQSQRVNALYTRRQSKNPLLRGGLRAQGGTRTTFRALQTLGTRENMRNPGQSEGTTRQYETKSVDIVHIISCPLPPHQSDCRASKEARQFCRCRFELMAIDRPLIRTIGAAPVRRNRGFASSLSVGQPRLCRKEVTNADSRPQDSVRWSA